MDREPAKGVWSLFYTLRDSLPGLLFEHAGSAPFGGRNDRVTSSHSSRTLRLRGRTSARARGHWRAVGGAGAFVWKSLHPDGENSLSVRSEIMNSGA